ncbi:MAG: glycosyltransferase family 39 protein [Pseudomonadota bacterium]
MDLPPALQRARRHLDRWGWDVLALALVLAVGLAFLPAIGGTVRGQPYRGIESAQALPFWATTDDLLLVGPDAGAWASSATNVHLGAWEHLDIHRMPTFPLLVGGLLHLLPDVALAGHLVNHLLMLGLPLVIYGLGRAGGGRALGLAAAVLVACLGPAINASRMYGVDATITFMVPAALLAAVAVRRWWWLAPLAGLVTAMACVSHYTTFPMFGPPLLFLILGGPRSWWRRILAVLLFLGAGAALVWGLAQVFPFPNPHDLQLAVSEGIAPGSADAAAPELSDRARSILQSGAQGALAKAARDALSIVRPSWLPWDLVGLLTALGVLGLGLGIPRKREGRPRWLEVLLSLDLPLGLALLAILAPLPVLAAAGAPERYGWNLLPVLALLLVRGMFAVPRWIDHGVRYLHERWPLGALGLPLALAVVIGAWANGHGSRYVLPPSMDGLEVRQLGELITSHFPPGGGAVCTVREAAAHAGRSYCPGTPCPFGVTTRFFRMCLEAIDKECGGEGPVPYVIIEQATGLPHTALDSGGQGPRRPEQVAFEDWLLEQYPAVATMEARQFKATLIALPRLEREE